MPIIFNFCGLGWTLSPLWPPSVPPDGAFGYVLKDSSDQQVIDAAEAVLDGDCWIHPRIQRIMRRSENTATGFNHRCRALNIAFRRGLLNRGELSDWEDSLLNAKETEAGSQIFRC